MEKKLLNIVENGSFKEFINFCINNYINNNINESIIEIAIKNNNFNLVQSLIYNGFILNDTEKEIINNNNINNINDSNLINIKKKCQNTDILGWIYH